MELYNILKGKIVIVGIGNLLRGDDGFGSLLIERLKDKVNAECLDTGSAPENYIGKIARIKPDTVLIVDAVHLEKQPGEYELLRKSDIENIGFTTHDISLSMLTGYLEKESDADIYILGVQPENVAFGAEMSIKLKEALEKISGIIIKEIGKGA